MKYLLFIIVLTLKFVYSADPYCINGTRWDVYCCASHCDVCGEDECGFVNGTYNVEQDNDCCTGAIDDAQLSCGTNDAPCLITGTVPPAYQPTQSPTLPTPQPTSKPVKYYNRGWFIYAVIGGAVTGLLLVLICWKLICCRSNEPLPPPPGAPIENPV